MSTNRRLIEEAFPLKKVSEDSQHEQAVSQGKPNSLLYWPARRPLAASRAAAIAALMPDPGDDESRDKLGQKITTITAWGSESGPALDYFRREIRKAFGGRPPRVLDMFAGGGAIPLEAMRLGCEVVANDYNPVAWFILKCTLEFPQRLAGKTLPLPQGENRSQTISGLQPRLMADTGRAGDIPAHVRWWGNWILAHVREELAPYYPLINSQPTVAYMWARTVPCPDHKCGAEVPLLKTLWLCQKEGKRRALRLVPDLVARRVCFEVWEPKPGDEVSPGTMSGAKSRCQVCGVPVSPDYIKQCGHESRLGARVTAVVVDTPEGKEYRSPTSEEIEAAHQAAAALPGVAAQIPHGLPTEPLPGSEILGFRVPLYGFKTWADLFVPRQLLALVTFVRWVRLARLEMRRLRYDEEWVDAIEGYLTLICCKLADYNCSGATWQPGDEAVGHLFTGAKLPITWDFVEINSIGESVSSYISHMGLQQRVLDRLYMWPHRNDPAPIVWCGDAAQLSLANSFDLVLTDPPYYDEVPYADVSDFFYVWIRRTVGDRYPEVFHDRLTPKQGELVEHGNEIPGRMDKMDYQDGMSRSFMRASDDLTAAGRMVIVFAHKEPDAWETLVAAMIQAGFTVTASWPVDTEKKNRSRAMNSAALASSIWMVCRKRPTDAGVGRYNAVRRMMEARITERLRYFWDVGISGPDFVWAAVGPALESYSAHSEVRRLDGTPFTVGEFLREVRRMVADFSLARILGRSSEGLDEWTRYYLIHRNLFGLEPGPVGECILLTQGYGLDLNELRGPRGILVKAKTSSSNPDQSPDSGRTKVSSSHVRLAKWDERVREDLGEPHPGIGLPYIDMLHRLIWLWAAGNLDHVRAYAAEHGLGENDLFWSMAQAIVEMAEPKSRERSLLEAIVAWGRGRGTGQPAAVQERLIPDR